MKLLTLNTHSLVETEYEKKLALFVAAVKQEQPDVIALQEVSQTLEGTAANASLLEAYVPCQRAAVVRRDNHALRAAVMLAALGLRYYWTWAPIKLGYGVYEEGIALMSRVPIEQVKAPYISSARSFDNWRTRRAVGAAVGVGGALTWFYSVHMGWWREEGDCFDAQWSCLKESLDMDRRVCLMGDFNNPAQVRDQGYDRMMGDGWHDTYQLAEKKDDGITVAHVIDGWREQKDLKEMRMDYILMNRKERILSSRVLFSGAHYDMVSDHFGVMAEWDENGGVR